jgi:hypothetical protein
LARNEALGTAHGLDTKERIDIEDPGTLGRNKDMVSHLRGQDDSTGAEAADSQAQPPNNPQRRSWVHAPTRPGAQPMDGLGINSGLEDDNFTVTIGEDDEVTIEPSPPTLSAQLVNTKGGKPRFTEFPSKCSCGRCCPRSCPQVAPDNHRGMWWKLAGAFLVMISIVIGVALGILLRKEPTPAPTNSPTSAPSLSPEAFLRDLLSPISSNKGVALLTYSTPQNKAFNWMVTYNTNLGNFSDEQIIQRYALATLYNSANGDNWEMNKFWLDNGEECGRWQTSNDGQVSCTDTGAVSQLDLVFNNLQGTLPPEIGLLTSLGECVLVIDCHDALTQSLWASIRIHVVILMVCFDCLCSLSKYLY